MKHICLLSLVLLFSVSAFTQKLNSLKISKLHHELMISAELDAGFKALAEKATETEEEDCTPPPCTGIIDPWTCECHSDIRDPWEDEKIASKMKAFKSFETAVLKGEGGKILPKQVGLTARKRFPGNSLKAVVGRLNYYNSTIR